MANEFQEKITKVKTAMDNRYENKQSNKKTDISGSFTGDTDSYPTVQAVKTYVEGKGYLVSSDISGKEDSNNKVTSWSSTTNDTRYPSEKLVKNSLDNKEDSNNKVTSWSSTTTNTHYPSEKLVKDSLDGKISKSQTSGLVKNDGTIDTNIYATTSSIPTKTSDLVNDGEGSSEFVSNDDSRLSDARTPTSHTHGNLSNDGKIGSTANLPLITTTGGKITAGSFGTTANTFAEGNHTHNQYLTEHQSLSDIGGTVTVEKQASADTGYTATYVIKQGGTALSPKINIPKDYLVKSASMGTCTTADSPVSGYTVGDKYLDFVINTKDSSATDEHLYILVSDLIDTYTAGSGLTLSNNEFSISSGDISLSMLASGVQTSLGYADTFHSSPAAGITSTQVNDWDSMASGGMAQSDVDARINQALDDLAELIYPPSS